MGNSKKGSPVEGKFVFTGVQQDFEQFKTLIHTNFEDKDQQWFPLVTQAIVKMYHNIVADRTERNATIPMQKDLNKNCKCVGGDQGERVPVTLDLVLVKNKKDVIGSAWSEHDKLKMTEGQLKT